MNESICRSCFHSYVCEQFNEHRNSYNEKCHFFNDHFVSAADVVKVVRCRDCKHYAIHALACRNEYMNGTIAVDGFCSYGERREDHAET